MRGRRPRAARAPVDERLLGLAGRACELERARVVVREHLGVVLAVGRATRSTRPRRRCLSAGRRAGSARRRRRGRARAGRRTRLAGDRRAPLAPDELLALERVERSSTVQRGSAADAPPARRPEDLADHRRVLEQRLLVGGERVEPRGDDALDGLGQRRSPSSAASLEHAHVLLGVERVAARAREQRRLDLGRQDGLLEQRCRRAAPSRRPRAGESETVSAFGLPPPQPGRRSSSSGRASDDEQRHAARPVDEVVDEVEQAVVGPVEVLEDQHQRARSASASKKRRQAANASLAAVAASARRRRGRRAAGGGARPSRASAVADDRRRRLGELGLGRVGASRVSRMPACALTISPSAQKLTPSPYGSERPWRQVTSSGPASDVLSSSQTSRLLPMPGTPTSVTSCGSRSRRARERIDAGASSSRSRPTSWRSGRAARRRRRSAPGLRPPPRRRPARPCPSPRPARRSRTRSRARSRRYVVSPTRMPFDRRGGLQARGGVDDVAGDHRLARAPARASSATSASPVVTAMRTCSSSPCSVESASRIASAARTARSGSSSCATGAPKTAITASPMNFSTVPPKRSSSARSRAWYGREDRAHVLGVEPLGAAGEADEVGEEDRDDLALLAHRARCGAASGVPHAIQKRARRGFSCRTRGNPCALKRTLPRTRLRHGRNAWRRRTISPRRNGRPCRRASRARASGITIADRGFFDTFKESSPRWRSTSPARARTRRALSCATSARRRARASAGGPRRRRSRARRSPPSRTRRQILRGEGAGRARGLSRVRARGGRVGGEGRRGRRGRGGRDARADQSRARRLAAQTDRVQVVLDDLACAPCEVVDVVVLGVEVAAGERVEPS